MRPATRSPTHRSRVRLEFTAPLNPENLFGHLAATAVPGVEEVRGGAYRRSLGLSGGPGIVSLSPGADHVACELLLTDPRDASEAIARCRQLLDLDVDPAPVDVHLSADAVLAPLVARGPGRRIPGTVDGGEMAIRAVLGQQISTAAARTVAARLAAELGAPVADPDGAIERLFPTAQALLGLRLPGPARRAQTLTAVTAALASGSLCLEPSANHGAVRAALAALPGIGPWTTEIVMMRALGDPDAFPASDLGVRRAAEVLGLPAAPAALSVRSRAWSPWRAYAVQYLWSTLPHAINVWPGASYPP